MNKASHPETRFTSIHGKLGIVTFGLISLQALIGFAQYWIPALVGGVDNGKALYKYHRLSGYIIIALALATVATATQTGFNKNVLQIRLWAVVVTIVLIVAGIVPRIKLAKFGWS